MNQKQSVSPHTHILVTFRSILKWEKKTSLHVEILSFIYKQKTKKRMKRDENEALHLIMMMKTIYKYLQKKKFNLNFPTLFHLLHKIIQKMNYP